jgi:mannan endo-1,4-beta-mannosidase
MNLRILKAISFALLLTFFVSVLTHAQAFWGKRDNFVKVSGTHFTINNRPYYYIGTNFWAATNLAATATGRERLVRELDRLKNIGVANLRILGASEGPDSEPWRIVPALQAKPGVFNAELLAGLDFVLDEMHKRDMRAVICMNNFWHWSGGMAQYLRWAGASSIPYPPPHPKGSWDNYQRFTSQFYSNEKAIQLFENVLRTIITRKNSISGTEYINDPTIMAWELANEPRGMRNAGAFNTWIKRTARLIKTLDPNHLVTTGSEGETPWSLYTGMDFIENHQDSSIDYTTAHIWAQNFGWYDPANSNSYEKALEKVKAYFKDHVEKSKKLGKPLVIEEFGLARDKGSYDPMTSTEVRDFYYEMFFGEVLRSALQHNVLAGVNFWAWAGEGNPSIPYGSYWSKGDAFIGDPPHEPQGWYSVYATDASTLKVISKYTKGLWWIRWFYL